MLKMVIGVNLSGINSLTLTDAPKKKVIKVIYTKKL